jgi:hypothetical protein
LGNQIKEKENRQRIAHGKKQKITHIRKTEIGKGQILRIVGLRHGKEIKKSRREYEMIKHSQGKGKESSGKKKEWSDSV